MHIHVACMRYYRKHTLIVIFNTLVAINDVDLHLIFIDIDHVSKAGGKVIGEEVKADSEWLLPLYKGVTQHIDIETLVKVRGQRIKLTNYTRADEVNITCRRERAL